MNPFVPLWVQESLILASKSPRRISLLKAMGFEFQVVPARVCLAGNEAFDDGARLAEELARLKAEQVSRRHPSSVVIGADTVVIVEGQVLGKPKDNGEAATFLGKLSGREHVVVTGVAVAHRHSGRMLQSRETTRVRFRKLTSAQIEAYVASREGQDKAGAYGIQGLGAYLVRSVEGCFYNVVGLPVGLLFDLLNHLEGGC